MSVNDQFATTTEEMGRAGTHVLDVNQTVQAELAGLRSQLEPLQALWRGQAAGRFTSLMLRWDNDARSLNEALRSIGEAIQGSRASYQQYEDAQAAGLSSITNALG